MSLVCSALTIGMPEPAAAAPGDPAFDWSAITDGSLGASVKRVAAGPNGSIAIAGTDGGWANSFNGTPLGSEDGSDQWVALLNGAGQVQWVRRVFGDWEEEIVDLQIDATGAVWLAVSAIGTVAGVGDGDPETTNDPKVTFADDWVNADVMVSRIEADGDVDWVAKGGYLGNDRPMALTLDGTGGAWVVGYMSGEDPYHSNFGSVRIDGIGSTDLFMVHYDADGKAIEGQAIGGIGNEEGAGVAVTAEGDIILLGWVRGTPDFGATQPEQLPGTMVVKVDKDDLGIVWVRRYASEPLSASGPFGARPWANDIEVDPDGTIWLAGWFNDNMILGPFTATETGGAGDTFVAHLDDAGLPLGLTSFANAEYNGANDIDVMPNGMLAVTGETKGATTIPGGTVLTGTYGIEGYAVWLDRSLTKAKGVMVGDTGTDHFWDGAVLPDGDLVAVGDFAGEEVTIGGVHHAITEGNWGDQGMVVRFSPGSFPPPPATLYHPLAAPVRILDSRPPPEKVGPYATPWGAGTVRDVAVGKTSGVPASADAVVLNATVTSTTAESHLTIWPKGATKPTASNLNWKAGQTIPNAATVKLGADGKVSVFNNSGSANVIFDVVGYYDDNGPGAGFSPLAAPVRVLDSRPPPEKVGPYGTPWSAATTREVTVAGTAGVPADAQAVVLNATVTGATAESHLTIWPKGVSKPTASSLNYRAGQTIPNAVTVKVGAEGKVLVYNNSGSTNVVFDVVGYFAAGSGQPFHPLDPARIQDSRPPPERVGSYSTPWNAATTRSVAVTGVGGVPSTAIAVLTNVTVTGTTANSHLTVWPSGAAKPLSSTHNWGAGVTIANALTTKVGTGGSVQVFNNSGQVNVIADVAGYYGP